MKYKNKKNGIILLSIFIVLFLLTPVYLSSALIKNQVGQVDFSVKYSVSFKEEEFKFDNVFGYDTIAHKEGGQLNEIGKPMLPVRNILIALPKGMKAIGVRVINFKEKEIPGNYNILPAQPPQILGEIQKKQFVSIQNNAIYGSSKEYPNNFLKLNHQTDLAGQSIASITIFPIKYTPSSGKLKLITSIEFVIEGINGYICNDYLSNKISESGRILYTKMIKEAVVNPDDVELLVSPINHKNQGILLTNYDYVIITNISWIDAFQPLADWKTQKGIPSKIVTTDWIYNNSNYTGSNKQKIRSFIQDAHTNWGATYFLLGGDTNYIPYHTASYLGDNIPTDTYYSDYDDDWICEVHVGRASVKHTGTSAGGIGNFINKTLNYEKNPLLTNFCKNISLFGFDLDATTDGEDCKIDIDDLYIPSNWSVTTVYDSHSGNHEDKVDDAVNNGQNIINHIDHSSDDYMGTGHTNHNWGLTSSEVDAFYNGNRQSIWYSIGCWACAYDYDNCIAEHFVRDTDGGGVAFIGNSRYGWYLVGSDDFASLRYDRYFFRSFFVQNHYKLGDLFSDHKMDAYNSMTQNNYNKYIFTELTLLGDPELPIWKENPSNFSVTYPNNIPVSTTEFKVHVESTNGDNINNSFVCLWKDDEVYLTGFTNNNGNITYYPSFSTTGTMNITVTKQDFLPYEGETEVVPDNQPPYQPSDPDPMNGSTGVSINTNISWTGGDPDGDPVTYDIYFSNITPPPKIVKNQTSTYYDPGTLEYNSSYYWRIVAWDNNSNYNISPIWEFTTEKETNNPPFQPSNPNPINGSTGVSINTNISWTGGDPDEDPVTYDVYFEANDNSPDELVSKNQSENWYIPGTLDYNTQYFWKIVAWDNQEELNIGPIWTFTTEANSPPNLPEISGLKSGRIGFSYTYSFYTNDPNEDNVFYYIKWGDNQNEEWIGPFLSGEVVKLNHTWSTPGSFKIMAKAKDIFEAKSDWTTFDITMPKNKPNIFNFNLLSWFFNKFPNAFPIVQKILGF